MLRTLRDVLLPDELPTVSRGEATAAGGWVRLRGVVEGKGEIVAGEVRLTMQKDNVLRHLFSDSFGLRVGEGVVSVKCSGVFVAPELEQRGSWGKLSSLLEAAPFREGAPGPHVGVMLGGWTVKAGQTVEVLARVQKIGLSEGGGLREAAPSQVSEVEAVLLGAGDNPEGALRALYEGALALRQPRESTVKRLLLGGGGAVLSGLSWLWEQRKRAGVLVWAVAALGLLGGKFWLSELGVRALSLTWGLFLLMVLLYWGYSRAELPSFYTTEQWQAGSSWFEPRVGARRFPVWLGLIGSVGCVWFWWAALEFQAAERGPLLGRVVGWAALYWVVCLSLLLVAHVMDSFARWRSAWPMLQAPRTIQEGAWGSWMGRLISPSSGEILSYTERQEFEGSFGGERSSISHIGGTELSEALTLGGEGGERVVSPKGAVWASCWSSVSPWTKIEDDKNRRVLRVWVEPGAHLLVVGRLQGGQFRSTGPESLFLFAAPGKDPRAVLWRRFLASWGLVVLLLGAIVWGISLFV